MARGGQGKAQDGPFPGEGPQDVWGGDAALSEVPATLPHSYKVMKPRGVDSIHVSSAERQLRASQGLSHARGQHCIAIPGRHLSYPQEPGTVQQGCPPSAKRRWQRHSCAVLEEVRNAEAKAAFPQARETSLKREIICKLSLAMVTKQLGGSCLCIWGKEEVGKSQLGSPVNVILLVHWVSSNTAVSALASIHGSGIS